MCKMTPSSLSATAHPAVLQTLAIPCLGLYGFLVVAIVTLRAKIPEYDVLVHISTLPLLAVGFEESLKLSLPNFLFCIEERGGLCLTAVLEIERVDSG